VNQVASHMKPESCEPQYEQYDEDCPQHELLLWPSGI
jgi:hypothetical protein